MKENYTALIDNRVKTIARLCDIPTSYEDAQRAGKPDYIHVDNYHGYALSLVSTATGGEKPFSFRNSSRQPAAAFVEMLDALIFGLEYGKEGNRVCY